nr:hypothetical protein [Tanacetum cinerariifolium]
QAKEEPLQNSDFSQLTGEVCGTKVSAEQKQNMEDTMLELLEDYRQKELYCMHNNVDDLIESVLNSKLPSINLKSQRLDKEKQEVKNIVEKPPKQPDNSLSMRDEHLDTIPETESDEVIKSSVENLVPISSEFEVTSDNESECDVPVCDDFTTFSNPLFDCINDFNSSDDKSLSNEDVSMIYSNSLFDNKEIIPTKIDPHYFNAESNLLNSHYGYDCPPQFLFEALLAAQREQELREQEQEAQAKEEPLQNSDFSQLTGEVCGTKVSAEQKQNMEDTMLELLEDYRQKELYCMHNNVDDLIEKTVVDNHNHNVNYSRITCTSKYRTGVVESNRKDFENHRKNLDLDH